MLDPLPATSGIEIPHALEVKRETGLVALAGGEELTLTVERSAGLQRVDAEEFARVQGALNLHNDARLTELEADFEKRVSGVDPVVRLRSVFLADYRSDPRYLRLLNEAGFDDEGNIR